MVIIIMERKMENLIEQYDRDQIANLLQNKKIPETVFLIGSVIP